MAQKIKYYMDEHVANAVVKGLRQRGVDVLTVAEAEMLGASDLKQLKLALKEERVIFTQDDDFLRLHAEGELHAGIVYAQQGTLIGKIILGLMMIYQILNANEMKGHIEFLQ
jgi:hypothetical protein